MIGIVSWMRKAPTLVVVKFYNFQSSPQVLMFRVSADAADLKFLSSTVLMIAVLCILFPNVFAWDLAQINSEKKIWNAFNDSHGMREWSRNSFFSKNVSPRCRFSSIFLRTKGIKSEIAISSVITFCWQCVCEHRRWTRECFSSSQNSNEIVSLSLEAGISRVVCKHAFAVLFVCCALCLIRWRRRRRPKQSCNNF